MNESPIESDPRIMMGKPVVAGTSITVEQVLDSHPRPTREVMFAAPGFASKALRADVSYAVGGRSE